MSPKSILIAILVATSALASGQRTTSQPAAELSQHLYELSKESQFSHQSSPLAQLKSPTLEDPYRPITPTERLHWFILSTVGPAHLAGVTFVSAGGTAVNRPRESGSHWRGAAGRFETGIAGAATGNAIETGVGFGLREDPRYFRMPQQDFKSRVGNVGRLTFLTRTDNGKSEPAYARYIGIVGSSFLSNAWRVHSEANAKDAVLRSSEGFSGRMAANAFKEFWPDVKRNVKRHVFRKYNWNSNSVSQVQAPLADRAGHD